MHVATNIRHASTIVGCQPNDDDDRRHDRSIEAAVMAPSDDMAAWGQVAYYIHVWCLLHCYGESSSIRLTLSRSLAQSFSRESASAIIDNYLPTIHVTTSTRIVDELADVNAIWRTTVVYMQNDPRSPCVGLRSQFRISQEALVQTVIQII